MTGSGAEDSAAEAADEAALAALGAGGLRGPEPEAWELFERAWPAVLRRLDAFERSLGVPSDFLEDCGQAVLLRVWRFRASYRGHSAAELAAWMHTICHNEAARFLTRAGRAPRPESALPGERGSADEAAGPVARLVDPAADPTLAASTADEHRALSECLDALERKHREVVELLFGAEPVSEREAAGLLQRSKSYINDLRKIALERLGHCLNAKGLTGKDL